MIVLPLLPLFSPLVLSELQQASLITSEECEDMYAPYEVVRVQSAKSPEVQTKTSEVLKRHEFDKESSLLAGRQTQPLIHVPVVCCSVEPSCKGHLKTYIIVSFLHMVLGHSELVPEPHCLPTWPPETRAH